MSLILEKSEPKIWCKTGLVFAFRNGHPIPTSDVHIFHENIDIKIDKDDFCQLVYYFLTNTDLEENDRRLKLIEDIKKLKQVKGYGIHTKSKRLGIQG